MERFLSPQTEWVEPTHRPDNPGESTLFMVGSLWFTVFPTTLYSLSSGSLLGVLSFMICSFLRRCLQISLFIRVYICLNFICSSDFKLCKSQFLLCIFLQWFTISSGWWVFLGCRATMQSNSAPWNAPGSL